MSNSQNLRSLLKRYGVGPAVIGVTLVAIVASVVITFVVVFLIDGTVSETGLLLAVLIPAIIGPIFSIFSFRLIMAIDRAEEQLRQISNTDELTGTFNRRYFLHIAGQEFERVRRYKAAPFSIAIMDFDKFKEINDGYGHLAGDLVLRKVGIICKQMLRGVDTFARYGGDEFVFLLPETNEHQAVECLTRILEAIRSERLVYGGQNILLAVSIGVAAFSDNMESLDDLLKQADEALYRIKHQGGSQVGTPIRLDKV